MFPSNLNINYKLKLYTIQLFQLKKVKMLIRKPVLNFTIYNYSVLFTYLQNTSRLIIVLTTSNKKLYDDRWINIMCKLEYFLKQTDKLEVNENCLGIFIIHLLGSD